MRKYTWIAMLSVSLFAFPMLGGCDRDSGVKSGTQTGTTTEHDKTTVNPNGSTTSSKQKTTETPNGTTTHTESHTTNP
jgi:hypothetical protein